MGESTWTAEDPSKPAGDRRTGGSHTMGAMSSPRDRRVSTRIGAIAESATLKVDAKAKSL